jgi:hypothetical protein
MIAAVKINQNRLIKIFIYVIIQCTGVMFSYKKAMETFSVTYNGKRGICGFWIVETAEQVVWLPPVTSQRIHQVLTFFFLDYFSACNMAILFV